MHIILKLALKDPLIRTPMFVGGLVNLAAWLLLIFLLPHEDFVSLSYNIHVGINWVGPWWQALYFPLFGLAVFLINNFIAVLIFLKQKVLGYFLVIASAIVQLLIFLASISTLLLHT